MITANFVQRTFCVKYKDETGTAFTIDVGGLEYLITAKHVVADITSKDSIEVLRDTEWEALPVQLVGHGEGEIDVSVLTTDEILTPPKLPVQASSNGLVYGQDVYFLGFPYGWVGDVVVGDEQYPLPFVKRATLSLFNETTGVLNLDGHNNPGFSGGPVIFGPEGRPPTTVAGIISGYMTVPEPVQGDAEKELTYQDNTGIIVAYKIEHALSLIQGKPVS